VNRPTPIAIPIALALAGLVAIGLWIQHEPDLPLPLRVPGTDESGESRTAITGNPVLQGRLEPGTGTPAELPGFWPQFRGPDRTGVATDSTPLARAWGPGEPRRLWSVEVGEGYAGPAVDRGRVYLMDYLRETQQDALRCLSLADGREIWRFAYPVAIKRNHGMSRAVPTVHGDRVVAMGPKCHVVCLDALSGELLWGLDLVRDHGATVPPWYASQCPLVDGDRVILAPGGKEALLMAVDLATGEVLWKTTNPLGWKMTHSSIAVVEAHGQRQFVYCASGGVVGVDAEDGRLLWQTTDWRISIANIPTPVPVPGDRLFLSGGYNAGSLMLRLTAANGAIQPVIEFRLSAAEFGATQHTPILDRDRLYGIHPDGPLVCLDLEGRTVWSSTPVSFGLGPLLMADGLLFAMDDSGTLTLAEATADGFRQLAQSQVLDGREAWGPLALAGGRLLARDLTRMVCLDVAGSGAGR
jgi:outer membrane protein assembly factor BamB